MSNASKGLLSGTSNQQWWRESGRENLPDEKERHRQRRKTGGREPTWSEAWWARSRTLRLWSWAHDTIKSGQGQCVMVPPPPPPPLWFWGNEGFGERESVQRGNTSPDPPALFDCNEVAESSAQIKRRASLELYDFFFFKCHDTSASHIDTVNIKVFFSSSDCFEWWNKWGAAKKRILKQCHRCINVFQDRAWELKRENNS